MKSGFVAIIGRPNAGKSTLMNALVGEKVSIVSWRPQTTRNKIVGIMTEDDVQVVFVDTPGIHSPKNELGRYMMKSVRTATEGVDLVVFVADAGREMDKRDLELLKKHVDSGVPVIAVLNKIDEVTREKTFAELSKLNDISGLASVIPVSALKGKNMDAVKSEIIRLMPNSDVRYYPDDMITDKSIRFMSAEIIREKALRCLTDEVPHGIGVEIRAFNERDDGIVDIVADIVCEKDSHKGIIIGKGGSMLKKIGTYARQDIESLVDSQVFLKLFVKVKEEWREDTEVMKELGYDKKNID